MFCLYTQLCCSVQKHCDKFSRSNRVVGAKTWWNQIAQICECSKFKLLGFAGCGSGCVYHLVRCEMLRECPILVTYNPHLSSSPYLRTIIINHFCGLLGSFSPCKLLLVHAIMIFVRHAFSIFRYYVKDLVTWSEAKWALISCGA